MSHDLSANGLLSYVVVLMAGFELFLLALLLTFMYTNMNPFLGRIQKFFFKFFFKFLKLKSSTLRTVAVKLVYSPTRFVLMNIHS